MEQKIEYIDFPVDKINIDAYQPSASQVITNTLVIKSGGVHLISVGINHVIISVTDKVIVVLPEIKPAVISSEGGENIYQSTLITIVRLMGDLHQIKTSNSEIKINEHMTSIYIDSQNTKYHFMAVTGGWIAY